MVFDYYGKRNHQTTIVRYVPNNQSQFTFFLRTPADELLQGITTLEKVKMFTVVREH